MHTETISLWTHEVNEIKNTDFHNWQSYRKTGIPVTVVWTVDQQILLKDNQAAGARW